MTELPKTEQELTELIDAKVNEATEKLTAQHNGQMATLRKKYDDDLRKEREKANLTAEEIAQAKIKEENELKDKELSELRAFKKSSLLTEKLSKESLPTYFKNDTRLLNAEDSDVDKVIKEIKKEYEANLPKGATHSTIVQSGNNSNQTPLANDKERLFEDVGNQIKEKLGM